MGTTELGAVIALDRGRPGRALTRMVLRGRALATAAPDAPSIDGQASLLGDVMAALASLGAKMVDLHVHEPSLEDVFFGFSD